MGAQLRFTQLTPAQKDWYLDLILRNRNMYDDFLAFAKKRFQDENVRFLRTMTEIPWNGNVPISADMSRGIYASFVREGSFWQVNLPADKVRAIEASVGAEETADWGPAVNEIRKLIQDNHLVVDFLADRENRAQAARA